jgi:hypothetical protein
MPFTVIAMLFLATAPIHLLPAILAVFLRCPGRAWVVVANLALWIALPLSSALGMPVQLGLVGALVLWLLLLRVVLNRTSSSSSGFSNAPSLAIDGVDHAAMEPSNKSLERTRDR